LFIINLHSKMPKSIVCFTGHCSQPLNFHPFELLSSRLWRFDLTVPRVFRSLCRLQVHKYDQLDGNRNVHYHVHNSPPPDPILSHWSAVHRLAPYFFKIDLNYRAHLHLGLACDTFPCTLYMFRPSHPTNTCSGTVKPVVTQLSPSICRFVPLRSKYFPQSPCLPHPCSHHHGFCLGCDSV
jgi:hypothetical protein